MVRASKGFFLIFSFVILFFGCNATKQTVPTTIPINLTGLWQITLDESQASIVSAQSFPNTVIDIDLDQNGSVLTLAQKAEVENVGCKNGSNDYYYQTGGWDFAITNFSGTQTAQSITIEVEESADGNGLPPHGQLTFTGNVNSSSSITGSIVDGCTGQTATFSAVPLVAMP